ncbi:MAG: hypothetical protein HZB17_10950 [Chloroflexi bacterium]|nr:hypothetical protein [Chloroflexota bacterium]
MRLTQLYGKTLRETPSDVQLVSHQLMIRAAVMRSTAAGTFAYLPLGARALHRARQLVCSAMDGQEFIGQDGILSNEINSYRDLPKVLYQNDQTRINLYSLAADSAHQPFESSLARILKECDLNLTTIDDGDNAKAFALPHAKGSYNFVRCDSCGYAATKDAAKFVIEDCGCEEEILKLEKVGTPNCNTIASLAEFLDIGKCQTLKAVMYVYQKSEGSGRPFGFVFVVVRGDLEVSERKILNVLGGGTLRPATENEIKAVGAVPGYASPRELNVISNLQSPREASNNQVIVLADSSIHTGRNFAAGANEHGYHFINVNYPRDFKATLVADIASPIDGLRCGVCHNSYLRVVNGIKVAGYAPRRTAKAASTYLDAQGKPQEIIVSSCEIDLESLLVSIIETHHDDRGIIFPESVAPYDVHLIRLGKTEEARTAAEALYEKLPNVLYDDRDESAGVKFADADLIGLPIRITVSDKSLKAGGAEVKRRNSEAKEIVPLEKILPKVLEPSGG